MIKRPRWLIALMLVLALVQAGNAIRALQLPAATSLIPPLEVLSGVVWVFLFVGMAVVLWRNPRATRRSLVLLLVFSTYFVARLTIFVRADYDRQRLPFVWLVTVAVVIVVWLRRKQWQ